MRIPKLRLLTFKTLRSWAIVCLLFFATIHLTQASYMLAKAEFAQTLIAQAWQKTLQAPEQQFKPWPWADTWPVARLQYSSNTQEDLYILAGATGSSLAFAPGHMMGTAKPGTKGNSVIGGHRDTHFAFLENVSVNDKLRIQTQDGRWHSYQVSQTQIRNINDGPLMLASNNNQVQLITCYPFHALRAGGPLRYVVSADLMNGA